MYFVLRLSLSAGSGSSYIAEVSGFIDISGSRVLSDSGDTTDIIVQ